MQRRTIAIAAMFLLLITLVLAASAAYVFTAQPGNGSRNLQLKLGRYGSLWFVTQACSPQVGGSVALIFQRSISTPNPRLFPDAGTYTMLHREIEQSSAILTHVPISPPCQ
jgi:hypothetical protein